MFDRKRARTSGTRYLESSIGGGIAMWAKRKTGYIVNSHCSCQCLTECRKVIISTARIEESYISGFTVPRGEERSVEVRQVRTVCGGKINLLPYFFFFLSFFIAMRFKFNEMKSFVYYFESLFEMTRNSSLSRSVWKKEFY